MQILFCVHYNSPNVVRRGSSNGASRKRQRIFALTMTNVKPEPANVPCATLVASRNAKRLACLKVVSLPTLIEFQSVLCVSSYICATLLKCSACHQFVPGFPNAADL